MKINELIIGVNIALERAALNTCPSFDTSGNEKVDINELITGVNNALDECPPVPTATGTAGSPTSTPTGTSGPTTTPIIENVAGGTTVIANGMLALPSIIAAIVEGVRSGSSSGEAVTLSLPSESGGASGASCASLVCTGSGTITSTITLNSCTLSTSGGGTVTYNGTVELTGSGDCALKVPLSGQATIKVAAVFKDSLGMTILTDEANLTAAYTLSTVIGGECTIGGLVRITGVTLTLNGTLSSIAATTGNGVMLDFNDTNVVMSISDYNNDCVPISYTLTFNGSAKVTQITGGQGAGSGSQSVSFDVTFTDFMLSAEITDNGTTEVRLNGAMNAQCLGGQVNLSTITPLSIVSAQVCPDNGQLEVASVGQVFYEDGGVRIHRFDGSQDQNYQSCLDPELLNCPAGPM